MVAFVLVPSCPRKEKPSRDSRIPICTHLHDVRDGLEPAVGVGREPFWKDEFLRDSDGVQRPESVAVVSQQHEGICRPGVRGAEDAHAAAPHFLQRQGELAQAEQVEQREE